jgi:ribonuclease HI
MRDFNSEVLCMAAKKFYAVAKGKKTGVFNESWATVKTYVAGYPGARYKGFMTFEEAATWLAQSQGTLAHGPRRTTAPRRTSQVATAAQAIPASAIQLYTDGGSRNTGNVQGGHVKATDKAAWAYLIAYQGQEWADSAGEYGVTNNKMEVTALVRGLERIATQWSTQAEIVVIADSKYVLDAITKGWLAGWQRRGWKRSGGQPVANQALWQRLAQLLPQFTQLSYRWTKGHATNRGNVFVDQTLNDTMDAMSAANPTGQRPGMPMQPGKK